MAVGHTPEPFVSASRERPGLSGRALTALLVGVVLAVTAAWFVALVLLAAWVVGDVF
jgi:hypothetical protein